MNINFIRQIRMSYQMKKTDNKQKKQEVKWNRMVQTWGHSDSAMNELYDEGDEIHGRGFQAYLNNIIVHRYETKEVSKVSNGRYDLLEIDYPIKTSKKKSFADIQKEQEQGLP